MHHQRDWYSIDELSSLLSQATLPLTLYEPLLTVQSLTVGLEAIDNHFSVKLLGLSETGTQFSRKVVLSLSELPVIWAESLCDRKSEFWRDYLNCGTQSLGRKLFNGQDKISRSSFSYRLFKSFELPEDAQIYCGESDDIIARRSEFVRQGEILTLTEWYLPSLQQLINHNKK